MTKDKKIFFCFLGSIILLAISITAKATSRTFDSLSDIHFGPYPPIVYPMRVGLATKASSSWVIVWQPGAVFVDEKPVFALFARRIYKIAHGSITDSSNGKAFLLPRGRRAYIAAYDPHNGYQVWVNNRWYGGVLELVSFGDRVTVINFLDLEDYLGGVVPAEMPASWHLEALKAQAVAARSYAYAHMGPGSKWYKAEGYDVVPDTRDQMYKGQAVATEATNVAVWQTRGIILKDSGRVKPGFYRAWVGDSMSMENLNIRHTNVSKALLEKITGVSGIIGVTVKQWDQNANARSIQVIGLKKTSEVYGIALAKMLNFSTAGILDVKENGGNWLFIYRGPGNGSRGLSQHGANMLAANGWRWEQILQQYYQDPDGKLRVDYMDRYKAPIMSEMSRKARDKSEEE